MPPSGRPPLIVCLEGPAPFLLMGPLRRYFEALREAAPQRVAILDTRLRDGLVRWVIEALSPLPPGTPDSLRLLDEMAGWLRRHSMVARALC